MIRRGQQSRRHLRRAEREAAKEIATDRGSYLPPDRADCYTKQRRQHGRLTDFVINAQVLTADERETVEYVDCCHGHCHLHPRNDESPRSIAPLNCVDDVQAAYTAAVALILNPLMRLAGWFFGFWWVDSGFEQAVSAGVPSFSC